MRSSGAAPPPSSRERAGVRPRRIPGVFQRDVAPSPPPALPGEGDKGRVLLETPSAADRKGLKGESPADPVRGRDGLLSSGSARINDPGVRGQNSRGKGQQPGARHKTCCLLMANWFYCTSRAALPGSQGLRRILLSWKAFPAFEHSRAHPSQTRSLLPGWKREDAELI